MSPTLGPVRTLHLIQPHEPAGHWLRTTQPECSGEASLLACASLTRHASAGDEIFIAVFGGPSAADSARSAGLRDFVRISPALGDPSRAAPSLRRLLARTPVLDAVVCWGSGFRRLARKLHRRVPWVEIDVRSGVARALGPSGVPSEEPGVMVDFSAQGFPESRRVRARARIGLQHGEFAITLLTDAPSKSDAVELIAVAMALHVTERPAVVVLPRASLQRRRAMRYQLEGAYITRAISPEAPVVETLLACDVAACIPRHAALAPACSLWLARHAMANGVPVVVPKLWARQWTWPDTLTSLVFDAHLGTEIAAAILPILDSSEKFGAVRSNAREWALSGAAQSTATIQGILQRMHAGAS